MEVEEARGKHIDRKSNNKIKHAREENREVRGFANRILHLMDQVT
jgi:hypothetical protein